MSSPDWVLGLCYAASNPVDCRACVFPAVVPAGRDGSNPCLRHVRDSRRCSRPTRAVGLWVQWLAFEVFDLLDIRRRGLQRGIERSVFLLNACGFIGASLLYRWDHVGPFLFVSAAVYLISTLIRARFPRGGRRRKYTCTWAEDMRARLRQPLLWRPLRSSNDSPVRTSRSRCCWKAK